MGNCDIAKYNAKLVISPRSTRVGKVTEATKPQPLPLPHLLAYVIFNYSENLGETIDRYIVTYNCKIPNRHKDVT